MQLKVTKFKNENYFLLIVYLTKFYFNHLYETLFLLICYEERIYQNINDRELRDSSTVLFILVMFADHNTNYLRF